MEESTFVHKSVLLYETVGSLNIKPGGLYVDGTPVSYTHLAPVKTVGNSSAYRGNQKRNIGECIQGGVDVRPSRNVQYIDCLLYTSRCV